MRPVRCGGQNEANSLGGAVAQSLLLNAWRGLRKKSDFKAAQENAPVLLSMGLDGQREMVTG